MIVRRKIDCEQPQLRRNLGDLWKFSPSSGLWTWMSGPIATNGTVSYGTLGMAADVLNDLWEFTPYAPLEAVPVDTCITTPYLRSVSTSPTAG